MSNDRNTSADVKVIPSFGFVRGSIVREAIDGPNMMVVRGLGEKTVVIVIEGDEGGKVRLRERQTSSLFQVLPAGDYAEIRPSPNDWEPHLPAPPAEQEAERDEADRERTDMMWQRRRAEERAEDAEARAARYVGEREAARVEAETYLRRADERLKRQHDAESSASALRERVSNLEAFLRASEYLNDRYRAAFLGKPVRDLDEAECAYTTARAALKESRDE